MRFRPALRVLSDEQIYEIHQAALEILWNTGVLVKAPAARDLLRRAGAWVDDETMLCRIPGYIVEEALEQAPSSFTIYARNPRNNVRVSTRSLHYEPMIGRLNCYDYVTGTTHRTTLEDVGHLVRLADALPSYHLLHSGAIMPQIEGVPIRATHVYGYLESVRNSSKVVKATSRERILAEDCLRMVAVLAGGEDELRRKPSTFTTDNPVAPLHHDRDQTEDMLEFTLMKRETAPSTHGFSLHLGKGELWALVAALAYALNNIFVRAAIRDYDLNDWMGVSLRAAPTFLFTLLMGLRARQHNPKTVSPASNWRLVAMLVGYGLLTFVIANPLLFAALRAGGVLVATPVTGTQAIWAGLIAALFLQERLNRTMVGGMVITVLGIGLLAVGQSGDTPISPTWWLAVPFALGTALCWALSGVLVTSAMRQGVERFRALAVATGSGIAALTLLLLFTGDIDVYATTPLMAQISLLLAGLLNAVALSSVTTALSLTSVASASMLNSLQIGLAPLFAWLFLGERLGWLMAVGILLIAGGVVVVQRAKSKLDERPRARDEVGSTI